MKKYLNLAGIENKNFAGHSLRSGFATVAAGLELMSVALWQ